MRFLSNEQPPVEPNRLKEWLTRLVININASLQSTLYSYENVFVENNFTTRGKQVIICKNTAPIIITLQSAPSIGTDVYVKTLNSEVELSGVSENDTGLVTGDSVHLYYTGGEWIKL